MTRTRHGQGRIFWGLLLIILGFLFLLDRMGRLDFGDLVGDFWPVIFILIGLSILFSSGFRDAVSGMVFILFGAVFLLFNLGVIDRHFWHYIWPSLIILAGLWIILRPALSGRRSGAPGDFPGIKMDTLDIDAVFSSLKRRVESKALKGGEASAVFGSLELDLTAAGIADGQANLELTAVFGSVEVRVPRDWKVVIDGTPVLGGIVDKRSPQAPSPAGATLYVKATAVFGSVEIKD